MTDRHLVSVLVPVAVERPYTYEAAEPLVPGTLVAVPLGTRTALGAVWPDPPDDVPAKKLRAIEGVFEAPPLPVWRVTTSRSRAKVAMAMVTAAAQLLTTTASSAPLSSQSRSRTWS